MANIRQLQVNSGPVTQCAQCPVREHALFQGVPLEQLQWTQHYREDQYRVDAKTRLFSEGDEHPYVYTLFTGWMMISKSLANGKRQILRFLLPGDFVGFQLQLHGKMTYSVHALTDCQLCAFPRADLDKMLNENAALATRMAMLNARDMAFCQQVLLATGQKNAMERMASLLLQLFIRVKTLRGLVKDSDENSIELPLSQEQIADALGMTKEHVNRTLREFRDAEILDVRSKRLRVMDEARLTEIAELDAKALAEQALL